MALRPAAVPGSGPDAQGAHGSVNFSFAGTGVYVREHCVSRCATEGSQCGRYGLSCLTTMAYGSRIRAGSRPPTRQVAQQKDIPQRGKSCRHTLANYLLMKPLHLLDNI